MNYNSSNSRDINNETKDDACNAAVAWIWDNGPVLE